MRRETILRGAAAAAGVVGISAGTVACTTPVPGRGQPLNPDEQLVCALDAAKCGLVLSSGSAATEDTRNRNGKTDLELASMDGDRNNAFLHSSWNARATVVTKDKAYVLMFSTAHEKPLTSSNPPGANLDDRHERMDLCNNLWGATVPSVTDILTTNQTRPVNALWEDSRDMQEDGTTDSAMMSTDTCSGIRLYFIRKDNGEFFG